jgi:hypothetical protein
VGEFKRDLVAELAQPKGSLTTSDVLERLLLGEHRANVMYSEKTVENTLFDLAREGLVRQAEDDVAEVHDLGEPAPVGERCWEVTEDGRERLRSDAPQA